MDKIKKIMNELLPYIFIVVLVLIVKAFIVAPIRVNGSSMDNTLKDSDIMLLDKISYNFGDIERFDIVVVERENDFLIKRVIGLPGEKVEYNDDKLYINNKYVKVPFKHSYTKDFKTKVSKDGYFVMGDNRVVSLDSREFGSIKEDTILGKTSLVIFPFDRVGIKK